MKFGAFVVPILGMQSNGLRASASSVAKAFVKALDFKRTLRVCNAYPYPHALHIFRDEVELTKEPMPYKTCRDFHVELQPGDEILFQFGDAEAGKFSVSDLPNNDAVMMLIIYRRDSSSTQVAFESHVYANLLNSQLAVVDTYKGPERATLHIEDRTKASPDHGFKSEELQFDTVVALNPGRYDIVLLRDGETVATENLVALNRESYIVLRTGVKANEGSTYAQELVVFPKSDLSLLGAAWQCLALALFMIN
jgi:hypothetical protein